MPMKSVTDDDFDAEVVSASGPVVVDFWAEWCPSCKQMAPHLDALADELGGSVAIKKLDVGENPMTAGKYGVRGLPTFLLFKDGKIAATHLGAMSKDRFAEWIGKSTPA